MLKEVFAASALVTVAIAPSAVSATPQVRAGGSTQYTPAAAPASLGACAAAAAPKCKWMEGSKNRCRLCKTKNGNWKQQYCEPKAGKPQKEEGPKQITCTVKTSQIIEDGKTKTRHCEVCKDRNTGKVISDKCFEG
ncbi:hypothetical protein [Nonomuraea sp. NPDC003214]